MKDEKGAPGKRETKIWVENTTTKDHPRFANHKRQRIEKATKQGTANNHGPFSCWVYGCCAVFVVGFYISSLGLTFPNNQPAD